MGRLWARRKSLSLRELSQGQAVVFVELSGVNATNCRSHAICAAQVKTARRYPKEYQCRAAPDDQYPSRSRLHQMMSIEPPQMMGI